MSNKYLTLLSTGIYFLFMLFAVSPVTAEGDPAEPQPDDPGYFLSLTQKGELIWTGCMQDIAGNWYDIWIVPGYVDPARECRINTVKTGRDFAEYGHKKKYSDLGEASSDAFEWAYDDCLMDFALKGSKNAWSESWTDAGKRTKQRVFGWWLSYPWAFLESTVSTVVRVPVGAAGTALGTVWGGGVVPVYYGVNSTVKGTLRFGVNAVVLPASACLWNTAAAPVMALVGQKPAPSRVDGFWVQQLSEEVLETARQSQELPSREELEALAEWGGVLVTTATPFQKKRKELQAQMAKDYAELSRKLRQMEKSLSEQEKQALKSAAGDKPAAESLALLNERGYDSRKVIRASRDLRTLLEREGRLSGSEINQVIRLLRTHPPAAATNAVLRVKTDPLNSSINAVETIK